MRNSNSNNTNDNDSDDHVRDLNHYNESLQKEACLPPSAKGPANEFCWLF